VGNLTAKRSGERAIRHEPWRSTSACGSKASRSTHVLLPCRLAIYRCDWARRVSMHRVCWPYGAPRKSMSAWRRRISPRLTQSERSICLNLQWFKNRIDAKILIEDFRRQYNEVRTQSRFRQLTPAEIKAIIVHIVSIPNQLR
jgi:hypothetical protein